MRKLSLALSVLLPVFLLLAQEKEKNQERLQAINEKITEINQKLEKLKSEKSSLVNDIYKIELQQELVRIEFNRIDGDLDMIKRKIEAKNREKDELEKKIAASQDNLRRILRILYKSGEMGYIKFFMALNSFDQLFRNYYLITILIDIKSAEIGNIRLAMEKLQKVKEELTAQAAVFNRLKNTQRQKLGQLHGLKNEKLGLMSRINNERETHLGMLEELRVEAQNLNKLLNESLSPTALPLIHIDQLKGRIPWPVSGSVVSTFGKKKNNRFETYTINNGIEIRPDRSDEIKAVLDGEIVYADYFSGYGNLIIVQHKRNFHTLYGHCSTINKKKGELVKQGEPIATVGSTGFTGQNTLYFEIRENLKAVNPLPWLTKR